MPIESGPIMRMFHVTAKPGHAADLLASFATTSADVVQHEPGNRGYFFGRGIAGADDTVIFVSLWRDLDAIKARFGEAWQESFLPPGYEDLIESHSLSHVDLSGGWHPKLGA